MRDMFTPFHRHEGKNRPDAPPHQKPSVCIVSHNGYGAISGGKGGFIGGVERQTSLLARWLAHRGYEVSFLTWDEGGAPEEMIDGVRVIKICRKDSGLPGLRFVTPKWTRLIKAMSLADADVYYQNCGECVTGQVALWCRMRAKRFVFSAASDADCVIPHQGLGRLRERVLYYFGLRNADRIIAQTHRQRDLILQNFGKDSVTIGMPCPVPDNHFPTPRPSGFFYRVLWVGRVWMEKRPEWFLDIAEALPSVQFDLIGPGFNAKEYGTGFSDNIFERAAAIPNLTVHGSKTRNEVFEFYRKADLLCCTSIYEGFPNTFLEAWSQGIPVVTTFDPDGLVKKLNLGRVAQNPEELTEGVRLLLEGKQAYSECSANCMKYFQKNHTMDATLPQMLSVLTGEK